MILKFKSIKFLIYFIGSQYIKFLIRAPDTPAKYEAAIKIYIQKNLREIEEVLLFKIDIKKN